MSVYMTCAQELFHDIMEADEQDERIPIVQSKSYYWQNGFDIILTNEEWSQLTYGAFVDSYTRRSLTFQSDALNACRAALTQMTLATGVGFLWGLPLKGLARALLWKPDPHHCLERRPVFPSWTWLGWVGRIAYGYWLEEAEDYLNEDEIPVPDNNEHEEMQHHRTPADSMFWHDVGQNHQAAVHIKRTMENEETRVLRISSTMARFNMKLVRHDEYGALENPSSGHKLSPQQRMGDQWTLLNRRGEALVNEVGEEANFNRIDYFFRLHPKTSKEIQRIGASSSQRNAKATTLCPWQHAEHEFVFIEYWPAIRDHHTSQNWLSHMVSALLVVRNNDGTYTREASVIMKCADWLAARPAPRVIELR
jgi:hypothetical protein